MASQGYYEIDTDLMLNVKMDIWYGDEHITTELEQTNWWVTSFSPKIQRPNVNDVSVDIEAGFTGDNRNALYYAFNNEHSYQANNPNAVPRWPMDNITVNNDVNGTYDFTVNY